MSGVLMKDRRPGEVADSDTYNRLPTRRAIVARGSRTAKTPVGPRSELLRVLIVDDYRASADTMSMLVGAWGHDARRAYDGASGLALAAAYQPDVLLLDIVMPGMSGLELATQVCRQARSSDCLTIAVTSRTDVRHRLQCEEAGLDLFLIKPIDLPFLRTLLSVESEYRLRSRPDAVKRIVILTTIERSRVLKSPRPMQLPCGVLQGTVAS